MNNSPSGGEWSGPPPDYPLFASEPNNMFEKRCEALEPVILKEHGAQSVRFKELRWETHLDPNVHALVSLDNGAYEWVEVAGFLPQ